MVITVIKERSDDYMYEGLEISIDDNYVFSGHHSEDSPEDNSLHRNFSDCYDIPDMLRRAYNAGVNGESFDIEFHESEGD